MDQWSTQIASDVIRDGRAVELIDDNQTVAAEVFRDDTTRKLTVTVWSKSVTDRVLDWFLNTAADKLEPFENGTELPPITDWPVGWSTQLPES